MKFTEEEKSSMKVSIVFAVLAILLTWWTDPFAGPFFELGIGKNSTLFSSEDWEDGDGVGGMFRVGHKFSNGARLHWTHISQWNVGPPFNNDEESTVDHLGISWCWGDC